MKRVEPNSNYSDVPHAVFLDKVFTSGRFRVPWFLLEQFDLFVVHRLFSMNLSNWSVFPIFFSVGIIRGQN